MKCQGKLDTMEQLIDGQFPQEIAEIFMVQGCGLFPEPKEIGFRCTCPDYASCCKHVSATQLILFVERKQLKPV
ncbi:MAG: hypothetical protein PHX62_02350 [Bacilli bacterium]|nr:hypothetical protein [Bacilli bacterium]